LMGAILHQALILCNHTPLTERANVVEFNTI